MNLSPKDTLTGEDRGIKRLRVDSDSEEPDNNPNEQSGCNDNILKKRKNNIDYNDENSSDGTESEYTQNSEPEKVCDDNTETRDTIVSTTDDQEDSNVNIKEVEVEDKLKNNKNEIVSEHTTNQETSCDQEGEVEVANIEMENDEKEPNQDKTEQSDATSQDVNKEITSSNSSNESLSQKNLSDAEMNEEIVKPKTRNITDLFDSDSEESVHNEDINTGNTVEKNCSDTEPTHNKTNPFDSDEETIKPVAYKKSKSSNKENDESTMMSQKEAASQKKEIQSESQRMLRESNISLPYHKPKSYNLKEFLARRSKLTAGIPKISNQPPSVAIKMPKEQLELISKKIEEREKEVKEFYKSDSESEDHGDSDEGESEQCNEKNDLINNKDDTTSNDAAPTPVVTEKNSEQLDHDVNINELQDDTDNVPTATTSQESVMEKDNINESNSAIENESGPKLDELENEIDKNDANTSENAEFQFNIDDLDESTNKPASENKIKSVLQKVTEKFNITPRLSGNPDEVIDLESGVAKESEVVKLKKRFSQHLSIKSLHKHQVKVNIVSVTGGEIHKETVAMKIDDDDDNPNVQEEKPGAKLQKLRGKLQMQMALKRSELWQQKADSISKTSVNGEIVTKEGYEEDANDDILDNEDEEELTETEDESEGEDLPEKPRKKSAFVDDEAQDEDEENDQEDDENDADCDHENDDGVKEKETDEEINDETSQQSKYSDVYENMDDIIPRKKTLKRIIKGFTEDSDDDSNDTDTIKKNIIPPNDDLAVTEDDVPPPHQTESAKTPQKSITQSKSDLEFLTPVTFITGLQNLNSASKLKDSPNLNKSPFPIKEPTEPSPFKNPNWHVALQKQLFSEPENSDSQPDSISNTDSEMCTQDERDSNVCPSEPLNITENSSENLDELANMCTGGFPSSLNADDKEAEPVPTTQDLLNVCSGAFTGVSNTSDSISYEINPTKEIKSLGDDQDQLISQLLDEEELENFKKKFTSPEKKSNILEDGEEVVATGGFIDSDDEDENIEIKKKKKKKLVFSDDEDSDDEGAESEEIDLHDNDDVEDVEEEPRNVDYDSEENEIVNEDDDEGPVVRKATDFFDKEAELSDSEWGSADEDEKGLDAFEMELGDGEQFDESKLRNDLEKIHMRRLQDDDNRDIKILQEMLLEDGELHGTGRERQFKWKNIDSMDNEEEKKPDDDDIYLDEEESEEQWRKKRHEREMFLKEKLARKSAIQGDSDDDDNLANESHILKLGQKILMKSQTSSQNTSMESNKVERVKQPFTNLLSKRGSFLTRNDQVLQRVAEFNKVSDSVGGTSTAKNSRNFVFQSVSQTKSLTEDKKRKSEGGTPNVLKKIRLSSNFSPLVGKKKLEKSTRAKELFKP